MNGIICFLTGGIFTGVALLSIFLPRQETFKNDLIANITELKTTQTQLQECNLKMTGMLMNRN